MLLPNINPMLEQLTSEECTYNINNIPKRMKLIIWKENSFNFFIILKKAKVTIKFKWKN
jgi:hypothetical protein